MLEFVKGDFFDFDADIRINTVNCVGVMGAGVALAFKNKYPEMFREYVKDCKEGKIKPGNPSIWRSEDMFSKELEIINFPTKKHWRNPSKYEYISSGLQWLSKYLEGKPSKTITLPALGCGHGGLEWNKVKEMIQEHLDDSHHKILVFEPSSSKKAGKNELNSRENIELFSKVGIKVIDDKSSLYPEELKRYTEKELYIAGVHDQEISYDLAIISSTKPSEIEVEAIKEILSYCKKNHLSIIFGGTAFDKKNALAAAEQGIEVGVFLPSGIFLSTEKLQKKNIKTPFQMLSIGDPFVSFDRKAYMPSVLSRIFLGNTIIFTTDRLDWIKKQSNLLSKYSFTSFYCDYEHLEAKDKLAIESINSTPISSTNNFSHIESMALTSKSR